MLFGTPYELLNELSGSKVFYSLAKQTGRAPFEQLCKIAKETHHAKRAKYYFCYKKFATKLYENYNYCTRKIKKNKKQRLLSLTKNHSYSYYSLYADLCRKFRGRKIKSIV